MTWEVITGDCLEVLPTLPDLCADAIITDLPYGTTACSWDEVIPFAPMWTQVKRLLKPRGAFVTTASQPFTSKLVMSNLGWFRYAWVWDKKLASGFLDANRRPLKVHDDVLVFCANGSIYNPQKTAGKSYQKSQQSKQKPAVWGGFVRMSSTNGSGLRYPKTIIRIHNANQRGKIHPTQKPVALYEYLIRTYTNEGDTVLDFTCGSGTTGVAAINTGRNFIGVELREDYADIARARISKAAEQARQLELSL